VREHDPPRRRTRLGRVVHKGAAVVDSDAFEAVIKARLGKVLANVQELRPGQDVLLKKMCKLCQVGNQALVVLILVN
jgi:hypothetical protein